jgi:DNA-binding NarL/FixJ family response regulator
MPTSPPTNAATTVVVARFEDLFARGLRGLIETDASLRIVAHDVERDRVEVILRAHRPRVAILDVDALESLANVRALSQLHPETRLVLFVTHPTTAECAQALAFGASAYLGRDTQGRDVLTAIHLASRGLQLIPGAPRGFAARAPQDSQLLTQREAEVLPMLQEGKSNAQIALALYVGVETIRTHARNIYRKLGVSSRRDLSALPLRPPVAAVLASRDAEPQRNSARAGSSRVGREPNIRPIG